MKNDSIKLVVTDTKESRLLQPTSEARLRLAQLITRRNSLEEKVRHLAETGGKLQEAADAERHAAATPGGNTRSGEQVLIPLAETLVVTRTFSLPALNLAMISARCFTSNSPVSSATALPWRVISATNQLAVCRVCTTPQSSVIRQRRAAL